MLTNLTENGEAALVPLAKKVRKLKTSPSLS